MKITKYEHACLDIQQASDRLLIDPGVFTTSLPNLSNVIALVITHVHPDHLDEEKIERLVVENPAVTIFSTTEVAEKLAKNTVIVPELGKIYTAGSFNLEFFGAEHAMVTASMPRNQNIGVLVNERFYYPGDSFTICPKPHAALAIPSMAPWMKISEAIDFLNVDTAQQVFPTHNGFLNDAGQELCNRLLTAAASTDNKNFTYLKPGESLEI
jgi:L-ascorbate metabolism protein UlaG (beta-lactamase superfamily)